MIIEKAININHKRNSKLETHSLRFSHIPKAKNQEHLKQLPN